MVPELPEDEGKTAWRRLVGNFYVQTAAGYAAIVLATCVSLFVVRSSYAGDIWLNPLFAYWDPILSPWAALAVAAGGAALYLIFLGARRRKPWIMGTGALLGIAGVDLAPGYGRDLPFNWLRLFLDDARYIYRLPDVFADYAGLAKDVFSKCRTRPGVTYWLIGGLDRVFDGNIYAISFFFIFAAAVAVPVLYYGGRALLGNEKAPWAAALFAVAPTLLIFGPEVDGFYCLVAVAVLVATIKAFTSHRPWGWAAGAGVALAFALSTSYVQAVFIPLIIMFAIAAALSGRGWGRSIACGLTVFAAAAGALAVFQIITGYDHIAVFEKAYRMNQEFYSAGDNVFKFAARKLGLGMAEAPGPGHRSYWIYTFGNLYAMFLFMGVPTAILYVRALCRAVTRPEVRRSFYGAVTIGFAVVFLAYNFSGLILGEVERIWLFLVPFFAFAAGRELARRARGSFKEAALVLGLNVLQALVYNLLVYTKI
ncbi:MAG: glycosyltransferase family 39 protein [Candidatus Zixiibacteriota bacterium]|jgi:hypothetical protein